MVRPRHSALVVTAPSGLTRRIVSLKVSATMTFPSRSSAIPLSLVKLAEAPEPSLDPPPDVRADLVFSVGLIEHFDPERALARGFAGYLSKPLDFATFADSVAAYLP